MYLFEYDVFFVIVLSYMLSLGLVLVFIIPMVFVIIFCVCVKILYKEKNRLPSRHSSTSTSPILPYSPLLSPTLPYSPLFSPILPYSPLFSPILPYSPLFSPILPYSPTMTHNPTTITYSELKNGRFCDFSRAHIFPNQSQFAKINPL